MDLPQKPWQTHSTSPEEEMRATWDQEVRNPVASDATGDRNRQPPPPLPPRPHENAIVPGNYSQGINRWGSYAGLGSPYGTSSMLGSFGGYGAGYSGYGGMGGGYGTYGGFGGYGGYGGYGRSALYEHHPSDDSTDFIRLAEESSRQAFQSIESIVHAFGSVSMMLESTYFAVHSSFRAVLGVADHFSKLRGHMSQVISSLAIIKTVNWFVRRLAFLLGVTSVDPSDERIWSEAERAGSLSPDELAEALTRTERKSSWPILIFFAVVFGTPWLIWKLLLRISGPGQHQAQSAQWMKGVGAHYLAKALYDFQTQNPREVAFSVGQELLIAPKQLQPSVRGWLLASDGKNVGLVPTSYVTIIEMKSGVQQQQDSQANH